MPVSWLQATQRLFKKTRNETPQPFHVRCVCGHDASGFRQAGPQQITCDGCSRTLFVMPRCVYPLPKLPPAVKPKPAPPPTPQAEAQTEAVATVTRVVTPPPVARPSRLHEWRTTAAEKTREAARATVRKLTPSRFQVLVLVILAAVGLTGYAMYRSRQRAAAEAVLSEAVRHGRTALADRDFPESAVFFRQAVSALDVLGRDDPTAREIRQLARETSVFDHLCPKPLHDLLVEAAATDTGRLGLSWPDVFQSSYKDTWMVWETMVSRKAGAGSGESKYLVDHPIFLGTQSAVLHADLPVFSALRIDQEPRAVVFAAQLQDVRAGPPGSNSWTVVLRPDSAFAWSGRSNLQALGLPIDDQTKAILAEQTKRLGIGNAEQLSDAEEPE